MAQGSSQWDAGNSQPPSFLPAGTPKHHVRPDTMAQPATGQVVPPSFSPASERSSGSRSSSSMSRAGAEAGYYDRASRQPARVSGGSSRNATNDEHVYTAAGRSPRPSGSGPRPTRTRGHINAAKVLRRLIAIILVAVIAAAVFAYSWVNSNLNKSSWLSDKDRGQATSWLVLGSDERDGSVHESYDVTGTRTDTILVLTKPKSGPSSLISIPRDSLVKIDGTSMKINAVYQLYGKKQLVSTVEDITGQKIDHVAMVKFGGVQQVVDALDGVELCYDHTVNDSNSGLVWQSGCHTADGGTALAFSRMRYSDPDGDFGRAARQRQVIAAIMKKATSRSTLTDFATATKVAKTALQSVSVDNDTTPATLLSMVIAFRNASSSKGITGSLYWTNPGYYVSGVGSCVLLDGDKNTALFSELAAGTHAPGNVGTLAESSSS